MKRFAGLLLVIFLLFFHCTKAQTDIGFRAGMLRTPYLGYDYHKYVSVDVSFYNSYTLSLGIDKHFSKVFSIGTNLGYDNYHLDFYTSSWGFGPTMSSKDYNIKAGYFSVYLFPQFSFGDKISFYFNFGPYFGWLVHSSAEGDYFKYVKDGEDINEYIEGDANKELWTFTVSIMQNFGFRFQIKNKLALITEFSIRRGMTILNIDAINNQMDLKFSIGLSYRINEKQFPINLKEVQPDNY